MTSYYNKTYIHINFKKFKKLNVELTSFESSDNFCLIFLEQIRKLKLKEIMSCRTFKWGHMQTGNHVTRQSKDLQRVKGLRRS